MQTIKNAWASVSYHKKNNFLIGILFSLALFSLAILHGLQFVQQNKITQIQERWKNAKASLGNLNQQFLNQLLAANEQLQKHYLLICFFIIGASLVFFGILFYLFFQKRETEFISMRSLGLSTFAIIKQLLIELFIPIVLSSLLVYFVLFVGYQSLEETLVTQNQVYFENRIPEETSMIKPEKNSPRKKPLLLLYDESSLIYTHPIEKNNFQNYLLIFFISFLESTSLTLLTATLLASLALLKVKSKGV